MVSVCECASDCIARDCACERGTSSTSCIWPLSPPKRVPVARSTPGSGHCVHLTVTMRPTRHFSRAIKPCTGQSTSLLAPGELACISARCLGARQTHLGDSTGRWIRPETWLAAVPLPFASPSLAWSRALPGQASAPPLPAARAGGVEPSGDDALPTCAIRTHAQSRNQQAGMHASATD